MLCIAHFYLCEKIFRRESGARHYRVLCESRYYESTFSSSIRFGAKNNCENYYLVSARLVEWRIIYIARAADGRAFAVNGIVCRLMADARCVRHSKMLCNYWKSWIVFRAVAHTEACEWEIALEQIPLINFTAKCKIQNSFIPGEAIICPSGHEHLFWSGISLICLLSRGRWPASLTPLNNHSITTAINLVGAAIVSLNLLMFLSFE